MSSIALDRFVKPLPDLLKCKSCQQCAWVPYVVCAREHVRCRPCAYQSRRESADCPEPGCSETRLEPKPRRSRLLERAFEDYHIRCKNPGCLWTGHISEDETHEPGCAFRRRPCPHCYSSYKPANLEAHYKVCSEMKIECPKGGRDCGGRKNHGYRKRRIMPTHIKDECAQWKCRVVEGCRTRSTFANLEKHETDCLAAHQDVKWLEEEVEKLKNAMEQDDKVRSALVLENRDLKIKLAEEEKRRASMVTTSTSTDPIEEAATTEASASTSAGVLTPTSRANIDPAGQATKRSSRIAAKRRSSQAFGDASGARPSPSQRGTIKPEPADA